MEYTIKKLGQLAGVSTRTLRYYDEIGILKPARISSSGYRIYGQKEIDILQQILFYRELGFNLSDIREILSSPDFDKVKALKEHKKRLIEKRSQIDLLIKNVEKSIAYTEGRIKMSDKEKFEGFKQRLIEKNEEKYGEEIREKYGAEAVEKSYENFRNMSKSSTKKCKTLNRGFAKLYWKPLKQVIQLVLWHRKRQICTSNGSHMPGGIITKKLMPVLPSYMLMLNVSLNIMIRISPDLPVF